MSSIRYLNNIPNVPAALGPYSQATVIDNLIYLSGQIGFSAESGGELVADDVSAQADQVMKNILTVLNHLDLDFSFVFKTTIFLADMNDFQKVNAIYEKWLFGSRPARSTVEVSRLPLDAKVEIEVIATLEIKDSPMIPQGDVRELDDSDVEEICCKKN